mmetsp:Transcript_22628/g.31918  ORF Transcript_22628/g.31918 Transcript_22628/m.31918 type:complete len:223 (-) Transcript_22628:126-794(-)
MNRLFGKSNKPAIQKASLDDVATSINKRGEGIDAKTKQLDAELIKYKEQMRRTKKGTPAYKSIQQRALRVLKQKKMYEKQRDMCYNQSFNIDQTKFATESVKETAQLASAMKDAAKELKVAYKDIDIDDMEDLHEDMSEMLEQADEINEAMGRAYGVPDEVDEDELLGELDALDDELENETEVPSYLVNAASASKETPVAESSSVEVDEFGLPKVPVRNLAA